MRLKRLVLKIGSNSLTSASGGLNGVVLDRLACAISGFREHNTECVLVTSGAVAAGMGRLNLKKKPRDLIGKQALAAVGQGILIERYSYFFAKYEQTCAQVLLSRFDLGEAAHYRNAQNTLNKLLKMGTVPIINENDTVAVEELCFGDNDRLSALVAGMLKADLLILLTDVDGLYTANPKQDPQAAFVPRVDDVEQVKGWAGGSGSEVGTGGMLTKIQAAEIAANLGTPTFLTSYRQISNLVGIAEDVWPVGTYFAGKNPQKSNRKRWLAYGALASGQLIIDDGARRALEQEGKSLLASGIVRIEGNWDRKDPVRILSLQGEDVARGLAELSSNELQRVLGQHTDQVLAAIPGLRGGEAVHRDNMTILN